MLKAIDLFAGIGGFRLAFEKLGVKFVFASEWDKHAQMVYEANFGEKPHGDITKILEEEIPEHDIICAGFPCQAFSISGKQRGFSDSRGTLFFDIARIAIYHKPKMMLLENVKNLASHDGGKTLSVILTTLDQAEYNVYYKILNAVHYGALSARERVYLVCIRKDIDQGSFSFPNPTHTSATLQGNLERGRKTRFFIDKKFVLDKDLSTVSKSSDRPIRVGHFNKGGQGDRIYSIKGPAITLSAYGGGTASKTGAYLIGNRVRKLTPRECAKVMGFPDNFKLHPRRNESYKQFGNSVAVPVISAIAESMLRYING